MKAAQNRQQNKRITSDIKFEMASLAIAGQQTITYISDYFNVSRTTVHEQKKRAMGAVKREFEESDDDMVLFTISVNKALIKKIVVALFLCCGSSYRGIIFFINSIFNYSIALGSVSNILASAAEMAALINDSYDLSAIQSSAADELFHRNQPILSVVDIDSRYCALLAKSADRDHESWGLNLLYLQDRGYAPGTCIVDGAKGLIKGHESVLPEVRLQHDHFHIVRDLKDCGRFLKNQVASKVTDTLKLVRRTEKAQDAHKKKRCSDALSAALIELSMLEEKSATFLLLASWLQHDVLQLAGYHPDERAKLYDFIVFEMGRIATEDTHRINAILTSLNHRRNTLLDVANSLNAQFEPLADRYKISINTIWCICYTARYGIDSCNYADQSSALEEMIGEKYDEIENAVLAILEKTHRCSSMVENLNSRVRPYLEERKSVSQKTLGLIAFFLNHKPFMRSKHERLVNKSPAESMTGKPHLPWLEMLGFPCVKSYAA